MAEPKEIESRPLEELTAELLKLQERANLINDELKRRERQDEHLYQITILGTYKSADGWSPETCWSQGGHHSAIQTALETHLRDPKVSLQKLT